MSLITPDFGLIFWMVLIFAVVFFVLAKFGFPMITGMVDERAERIEGSLKAAAEAEARLAGLAEEQARMIEETRLEQSRILKDASEARDRIIADAREKAAEEAGKLIAHAKTEIAAERESALRDISAQISMISVQVAEKIVRGRLEDGAEQHALVDKLVDEVSNLKLN